MKTNTTVDKSLKTLIRSISSGSFSNVAVEFASKVYYTLQVYTLINYEDTN